MLCQSHERCLWIFSFQYFRFILHFEKYKCLSGVGCNMRLLWYFSKYKIHTAQVGKAAAIHLTTSSSKQDFKSKEKLPISKFDEKMREIFCKIMPGSQENEATEWKDFLLKFTNYFVLGLTWATLPLLCQSSFSNIKQSISGYKSSIFVPSVGSSGTWTLTLVTTSLLVVFWREDFCLTCCTSL